MPPDNLLAVRPGLPPQGLDGSMDGRVLSYRYRWSFTIERLLNPSDKLVRHLGSYHRNADGRPAWLLGASKPARQTHAHYQELIDTL